MSSQTDPNAIKAEWKKRSRRQAVFGLVVLIGFGVILAGPVPLPLRPMALLGLILFGVAFTLWNSRCPACNAYRGLNWFTGTCPKCNARLTD